MAAGSSSAPYSTGDVVSHLQEKVFIEYHTQDGPSYKQLLTHIPAVSTTYRHTHMTGTLPKCLTIQKSSPPYRLEWRDHVIYRCLDICLKTAFRTPPRYKTVSNPSFYPEATHTTLLGSFPGSPKVLLHKRAYLRCVFSCSASLSRFCPAPTPPHE